MLTKLTVFAVSVKIKWTKMSAFKAEISFSSFKPFQKQQPRPYLYSATVSQACSGQPRLSFCLSQQYGTSRVPCQVRKSMLSLNQAKSPLRTSSLWQTILRLKLPLKIKALLYSCVPGYRRSIAKAHLLTSSYISQHQYQRTKTSGLHVKRAIKQLHFQIELHRGMIHKMTNCPCTITLMR